MIYQLMMIYNYLIIKQDDFLNEQKAAELSIIQLLFS